MNNGAPLIFRARQKRETRETSHRKKKLNFISFYTYQHFEIKTYVITHN